MSPVISLDTEADTERLAEALAKALRGAVSVGLSGPLGSGKTTLIRHWVKALGIKEAVSSPTYTLCHLYAGATITVEHWDLYRLSVTPEELLEPPDSSVLRVIEWPEKVILPEPELTLSFTFDAEKDVRKVRISGLLASKVELP